MVSPIKKTLKIAYIGFLLALALCFGYLESLIPIAIGIPGVKLGLSNLPVIICLYLFDFPIAMFLTILKAIICGFLFGNLYGIIYGLAGAILSCSVMGIAKKTNLFHIPFVSSLGGIFHNIGQLLVACFVVETFAVIYYFPVLLLAGLITGIVTGFISSIILPYLNKFIKRSEL